MTSVSLQIQKSSNFQDFLQQKHNILLNLFLTRVTCGLLIGFILHMVFLSWRSDWKKHSLYCYHGKEKRSRELLEKHSGSENFCSLMACDNFAHISLIWEIAWPSGKWGRELYSSHREALQITQEAGIYNLLVKEEANVGNNNTIFYDKYLGHKYLLPPFCTQYISLPKGEGQKSNGRW